MTLQAARPWLLMGLIFLVGALTGALLAVAFGPRPGPPGPEEMRTHWMHHLTWRLHLTDDQQAKIQPIVFDAESQIQAAHRDDIARISSIMAAANSNIEKYLQPDQQAELKRMEDERRRMFEGHMRGPGDFHHPDEDRGPGPPPPPGA